eukprot:2686537-Amphidinium_carterae.3
MGTLERTFEKPKYSTLQKCQKLCGGTEASTTRRMQLLAIPENGLGLFQLLKPNVPHTSFATRHTMPTPRPQYPLSQQCYADNLGKLGVVDQGGDSKSGSEYGSKCSDMR